MKRPFAQVLALALISTTLIAEPALALTCIAPRRYTPTEELQRDVRYAEAVFAARVISTDQRDESVVWTVDVLRVWKGKVWKREVVKFDELFSSAPPREIGRVYIFFAFRDDGILNNTIEECSKPRVLREQYGRPKFPPILGLGRPARNGDAAKSDLGTEHDGN